MSLIVFGHHRVKDYQTWRPYFDSDEQRRLAYGVKTLKVLNPADEPNNIHLLFEIESAEKFQECLHAPDLGNLMQEAGVIEKPEFTILNER
jgi:RNA-binding protein YlmH